MAGEKHFTLCSAPAMKGTNGQKEKHVKTQKTAKLAKAKDTKTSSKSWRTRLKSPVSWDTWIEFLNTYSLEGRYNFPREAPDPTYHGTVFCTKCRVVVTLKGNPRKALDHVEGSEHTLWRLAEDT